MRKKKWKKVLIWTASVIVVLGVGGLFVANYMVDKMISSLADSLESEIVEETVAEATDAPDAGTAGDAQDTEHSGTETAVPDNGSSSSGSTNSSTNQESSDVYKAEVSVDKAKNVQEKITVSEKAQLTSVFLKQLSVEDIKALQALASGGLSIEEKNEARALILEKLTPEQYDELIIIAKKYGMSQGKSYEQASKEY
ncbi:hypothetical protein KP806_15700 [Paenibacillus sp. N4]|uniref:hypothetical protein n=1 Tax=Paenibacillus vietnamensis TaxID=2590547 RepID=UPI001CD10CE1|nr:hypothetical protein [Paenibacillus vietnamensis]MCA0756499.1 hypothetical protein [Paenibacillus vietnamensis]